MLFSSMYQGSSVSLQAIVYGKLLNQWDPMALGGKESLQQNQLAVTRFGHLICINDDKLPPLCFPGI